MTTRRTIISGLAASALGPLVAPAVALGEPPAPPSGRPRTPLKEPLGRLQRWVQQQGGELSACAVSLPSGEPLASVAPGRPLNPASNVKILTAAVALSELGPQYRFTTGLYGRLKGGRIDPLVVRGNGDPSLTTRDLWRLVSALSESGLKQVGTILVDQSHFDDQFVPPAFGQQPKEWAPFRAPVSAIAVDRNSVTLHVVATTAGKPATLWFEPPGFARVEGTIQTAESGSGQRVRLNYESEGGRLIAKVGGSVAQGLPRLRFTKRVDDPRLLPGFLVRDLLTRAGVQSEGAVHLGGKDIKRRLVFQQSDPLTALLLRLGKNSDNFYAEMILKAIGSEQAVPASSAAGAQVVERWLKAHTAWGPGFRIENGSGLFDSNRVSSESFVQVLRTIYETPALYPEFLAQLAIGGTDGTLRSRLRGLRGGRQVRAKTGTLANANALSGYVLGAGNSAIAFSFLVNGIAGQHGAIRSKVDDVVRALSRLA